jgi:hypothetical protein
MKKLIPMIIIGVLLACGLGAAVSSPQNNNQAQKISLSEQFSFPTIQVTGDFISVSFEHMNAWFNEPGYPMIPAYRKTFTLPFGTTIQHVQVTFSGSHEQILTKPIQPGSQPLPLIDQATPIQGPTVNADVYASTNAIPQETFRYTVGAGLDGLTHVFFLTVTCYPVHYTPASNTLTWHDRVDIQVLTTEPSSPALFGDQYDLLIIAPAKFSTILQPLIDHKNTMGMRTIAKTVEDITNQYTGRDKPEQIKYAIKDIIETSGIHYVLLMGGIKSFIYAKARDDANQGTKDWWVPVRYTNLYDGGTAQDTGCISDLYYADIYNGTGAFSTWDSNNNNIFAE